MPTVLRKGPYRFFFYSADSAEPPHIHIERELSEAKFWLDPVRLEHNEGFGRREIYRIRKIVEENAGKLLRSWNEFFESEDDEGATGNGE
jgi:hypothetical protein